MSTPSHPRISAPIFRGIVTVRAIQTRRGDEGPVSHPCSKEGVAPNTANPSSSGVILTDIGNTHLALSCRRSSLVPTECGSPQDTFSRQCVANPPCRSRLPANRRIPFRTRKTCTPGPPMTLARTTRAQEVCETRRSRVLRVPAAPLMSHLLTVTFHSRGPTAQAVGADYSRWQCCWEEVGFVEHPHKGSRRVEVVFDEQEEAILHQGSESSTRTASA